MKFFKVRTELKSYLLPIVKIVMLIILIVIMIFRKKLIPIKNEFVDIILSIVCFILLIISILSLYCSVAEIFYVYENRNNLKLSFQGEISIGKLKTVEDIIFLLEQNDIIEIEIRSNDDIIKIGASSDFKQSNGVFFDKKYYIGNTDC